MILLLAGTSEARQIAWGLADAGRSVTASLAGVTRNPVALPVPTRTGGFGGDAAFRAYLQAEGITAIVDATHPFAANITDRAARISAELGLDYVLVRRPAWSPSRSDNWTTVAGPQEVAPHVPDDAVVFLATGRQTIDQFGDLEGRRVLVRVVDPPRAPLPFEGGEYVIGRPPFTVDQEVDLFQALSVTHLVAKNAGGTAGRAKLDAARRLGLPVILIDRPAVPEGAACVETVQQALSWVEQTCPT